MTEPSETLPDPIECTACAGEGGENVFKRCTACEGAGVLLPCLRCGSAHLVDHDPTADCPPVYCASCGTYTCESVNSPGAVPERQLVERVDPRDFLDPTARSVAYLDIGEEDGARSVLAQVPPARLRRLGEHYGRLSTICSDLVKASGGS